MKRLDDDRWYGSRQWVYKLMGGISSKPWEVLHTSSASLMIDHRLRFKLLDTYSSCLYINRRGLG